MPKCKFLENDDSCCKKQATYGIPGKLVEYCKIHKKNNMKYIRGKHFCKCGITPSFGPRPRVG